MGGLRASVGVDGACCCEASTSDDGGGRRFWLRRRAQPDVGLVAEMR